MILPSLVDYYDRVAAEPDSQIAPLGSSRQKISFIIVLEPDGKLHQVQPDSIEENGKRRSRSRLVLGQSKPTGQGINPCFLWDNLAYLLGYKVEDPNPDRTTKSFEAFRDRHLKLQEQIADPAFAAVCSFLKSWSPQRTSEIEGLANIEQGFGIFQIRGQSEFVHERPAVVRYWSSQSNIIEEPSDEITGYSLFDDQRKLLARLHEPKIKGVVGGQSSGAVLIGFNEDAFTSYGKEQSYNAPTGQDEAFKYCTALNSLLADSRRRVLIGDATVIFWSAKPTPFEYGLAGAFIGDKPEDAETVGRTRTFFNNLRQGTLCDELGDLSTPFYVLGLSPNAARVSVRYWLAGTVGDFATRLRAHLEAIEIVGARETDPPLTIRRIVNTTARLDNGKPDYDSISPHLSGDLARAVLTGNPYPNQLLAAILARIGADGVVDHPRAAIIKACLIRNFKKETPVALNPEHKSPAYHCGRLLAVLDYAQGQSIGNVNAGVVRKFYSAASSQPSVVFGRLLAITTKAYLPKIMKENPGLWQRIDKEIQQIIGKIGDVFPTILGLDEQGTFAIGFYEERAELPDTPPTFSHKTDRGDQVRSKSEVILANTLYALGINYEYERQLAIPDSRPLRPDFTVVTDQPSDTIYIEYLGMLDNEDYKKKWGFKLEKYRAAGITPLEEGGGPNGKLLIFGEAQSNGLDTAAIRKRICTAFNVKDSNTKGASE